MHQFTIERDPLCINAEGGTRAGLIVAGVKGLFSAANVSLPEAGEEVTRPFELTADTAIHLILAVLRAAAGQATANQEIYSDVSFSLITDKKAVGAFVGRKASAPFTLPAVHGIDGEVKKGDDALWRATIALGSS